MRENAFQHMLIKKIKQRFPGCMVLKNDPNYIQGIPDLIVLHGPRWAALEVKRSARASHRPNQEHYVEKMNQMSYARFIYPENEEEILDELQQALRPRGQTCPSEREQISLGKLRYRKAQTRVSESAGYSAWYRTPRSCGQTDQESCESAENQEDPESLC